MKKKITLLLAFSIILSASIFGQRETSNWYFGDGAGLHFNRDGTVVPLNDGQLTTFEGCTTISDSFGKLQFYTDGITVYNRKHAVMENGRDLYGDSSSTQSAIIVPKPEDSDIFYIFTVDTSVSESDPDFGLNYSVVDITLNGGDGAVIEKNNNLLRDCSEKITAVVKDCSDKSIWVITLSSTMGGAGPFNTYHAFEVNPQGVVNTAVKTTFPNLTIEDPRGYLKLSPDGTKMVSANSRGGLYVYDFDAQTGLLSNENNIRIQGTDIWPYGVEFSPSGKYFYVLATNDIMGEGDNSSSLFQFDLFSNDIWGSHVILDQREAYRGALQLGANGKIYRTISDSYFNGTPYLGLINNPDLNGLAADYQHNAVFLGDHHALQGLPPFIQSFFFRKGLVKNADGSTTSALSLCEGEGFVLQADEIPGATYVWEKDGVPFPAAVNHIYEVVVADSNDSGTYAVEVTPPDDNHCPSVGESIIDVIPIPEGGSATLVQCDVDSNPNDGITLFNLEQAVQNPEFTYIFYESIADRDSDSPVENPIAYSNTQAFNQTIYFEAINSLGCENIGELHLEVRPSGLSGPPQHIFYSCDNDPNDDLLIGTFELESIGEANYPGIDIALYASLEDVTLEQNPLPGSYSTESTLIYLRMEQANLCLGIEHIELVVNPSPRFTLEEYYTLCTDNPLLILSGPEGFDTYSWLKKNNDSEDEISTGLAVEITELGDYVLEVGYFYNIDGNHVTCNSRVEFRVIPSNKAIIQEIVIEDFSNSNTVQIVVSGDGSYSFSLDGVNYQDNNIFNDVLTGFLTAFVRDNKGCGITQEQISVMGYPKFFTPNGDGINDFWRIVGISDQFQSNAFITIYDRFGMLVAQISGEDQGWNGTYNSQPLPSSDYWFKVNLEDGRLIKGHFALKR